jgi:S-DNA-T family DNA segregation ATPase FtsK/SpoIIIE
MARKKKDNPKSKRASEPFHIHLSPDTKRATTVIVLLALAVLSIMSFLGMAGGFGLLWGRVIRVLFGHVGYILPIVLFGAAVALGWPRALHSVEGQWGKRAVVGFVMCLVALVGAWHMIGTRLADTTGFSLATNGGGAGLLGAVIAVPIAGLFGFWAGLFVMLVLLCVGTIITLNIPLFVRTKEKDNLKQAAMSTPGQSQIKINDAQSAGFTSTGVEPALAVKPPPVKPAGPTVVNPAGKPPREEVALPDAVILEERKDWKLPPFDLLEDHKTDVDSGNIEANVAIIQKTLADFGIEVEMGEVNVGPTVTQYTFRPATGVKLSQIAGLKSDLALALAAQAIRMELPIPGKSLVGIEVPNRTSRIVGLREVLQTTDFINHASKLAFALGRDVAGKAQVTDLAKMPHLLIAGATGKGKSVALNALIISMLYRNTPQDVKFIMVDPKRVEMTVYNGIPHLLTPPITEPEKAVNALKWAVSEMDRRYKLLAESKKRNIGEYNSSSGLPLSYIVVVVDELADLMAVAQADIEAAIVRLAQMARAVGIHLVLATQSPRTDIITGLIKANITSRVAFAVGSQIESRIILDMSGAESLLGNGDMLFISSEFNKPKRIQGAFVNDKETHKVVDFFKQQTGAVIYNDEIVERPKHALGIPGFESGDTDSDDLLDAAREEVTRAGKASASFLQRRLKIGYARAARLLDLLEEQGVIGPGEGAKAREVYGATPRDEGYGEASSAPPEEY